jgi:hypothetical protein
MHGKYYPALHMGDFDDLHVALRSVGVTGHAADLCIAGLCDSDGVPVAYMANLAGEDENLPSQPMLVMLPLEDNRVGLYLGFFGLLADSRDAALMLGVEGVIDAAAAGEFEEPPTFDAFAWNTPRRVLQ